MEVVEMVLVGKVNKSLVSLINLAGAIAVGLCGKDARLLTARLAPNAAALGFVGEVACVNPAILRPILANGHIPVIASVAADDAGPHPDHLLAATAAVGGGDGGPELALPFAHNVLVVHCVFRRLLLSSLDHALATDAL